MYMQSIINVYSVCVCAIGCILDVMMMMMIIIIIVVGGGVAGEVAAMYSEDRRPPAARGANMVRCSKTCQSIGNFFQ